MLFSRNFVKNRNLAKIETSVKNQNFVHRLKFRKKKSKSLAKNGKWNLRIFIWENLILILPRTARTISSSKSTDELIRSVFDIVIKIMF